MVLEEISELIVYEDWLGKVRGKLEFDRTSVVLKAPLRRASR